MKISTSLKMPVLLTSMLLSAGMAFAGDGTKENPYTVAELLAQKDALANTDKTVWVKADLKGLGEDGAATNNADTDGVKHMAALFGDATGTFVGYSWQILGQLDLADLTNTKDLLIALTYGTTGHAYGNTASPQYASNYEPADVHFSLEEVHGALSLDITNGLRGYHITSSYLVPDDVIAVKVNAGYSASKGAYVTYTNFDGADTETAYVTPKDAALVLMATPGIHSFVLTSALYDQTFSNGNSMNPGTQAGVNKGTTANRARLRFVNDGTKAGFEHNSDENCTVTLQSKDEVFLQVNSQESNFWGKYSWETDAKDWITWGGGKYSDFHEDSSIDATLNDNGKMINENVYDLQGRRVQQPSKGLHIVNGKKINF